jgi:hypothetical protein
MRASIREEKAGPPLLAVDNKPASPPALRRKNQGPSKVVQGACFAGKQKLPEGLSHFLILFQLVTKTSWAQRPKHFFRAIRRSVLTPNCGRAHNARFSSPVRQTVSFSGQAGKTW